jgi:hypothetical protein
MAIRTQLSRVRRGTLAIVLMLLSGATHAATLTCQDRCVRTVASWGEVLVDSSRAPGYGVFDDEAHALLLASYPLYPGNWMATTSLDVFMELSEALLPIAGTTWGVVKGLYRDAAR